MYPLEKNGKTIADEFSNVLTKSERKPPKIETDRGSEWYNSTFQNFLKVKKTQHNSRFTDKSPSIAERVIRSVRNLLKKPVFEKRNAASLSELPSVIKQYNKTIHSSQLIKHQKTISKYLLEMIPIILLNMIKHKLQIRRKLSF